MLLVILTTLDSTWHFCIMRFVFLCAFQNSSFNVSNDKQFEKLSFRRLVLEKFVFVNNYVKIRKLCAFCYSIFRSECTATAKKLETSLKSASITKDNYASNKFNWIVFQGGFLRRANKWVFRHLTGPVKECK